MKNPTAQKIHDKLDRLIMYMYNHEQNVINQKKMYDEAFAEMKDLRKKFPDTYDEWEKNMTRQEGGLYIDYYQLRVRKIPYV